MPFSNAVTLQDPATRLGSLINPGSLIDLAYGGLLHSVRTGELTYPVVHGRTFWEDLDVEKHRRFIDESMLVQSAVTSPQVAELYDWSAVTDVVDSTSFDLEMLATVGGRERALEDSQAIAADAGLVPTRVLRGQQALVFLEYACASC